MSIRSDGFICFNNKFRQKSNEGVEVRVMKLLKFIKSMKVLKSIPVTGNRLCNLPENVNSYTHDHVCTPYSYMRI